MNKTLASSVLVITLAFSCTLWVPSDSKAIKPFTSDGCSLFPDASIITGDDWCTCCFEHDVAYWKGGTRAERQAADLALRHCVKAKTGNADLARIMFEGVKYGGSPYFANGYRWGYGWGFDRKYGPLSASERAEVRAILARQIPIVKPLACKSAPVGANPPQDGSKP